MKQSKSTDELNDLLENMKPCELNRFFKDSKGNMADEKAFYYYMRAVLDEKNIKLKDVYSFAGVSESYGSKILRMEKHTKNRDMIICFCIAGHFNVEEINRALKYYGMSILYAREPRDACIIVAVKNRIFDIGEIDDILTKNCLRKLSKDE